MSDLSPPGHDAWVQCVQPQIVYPTPDTTLGVCVSNPGHDRASVYRTRSDVSDTLQTCQHTLSYMSDALGYVNTYCRTYQTHSRICETLLKCVSTYFRTCQKHTRICQHTLSHMSDACFRCVQPWTRQGAGVSDTPGRVRHSSDVSAHTLGHVRRVVPVCPTLDTTGLRCVGPRFARTRRP